MKPIVYLIPFLLLIAVANSQNTVAALMNADSVLIRTCEKLHNLKNIRYDNIRELNYSSENYLNIAKWSIYYDFTSTDTIAGFKYQIDDSTSKQVFNGTEKFELNKKARTIQINDHPDKKSVGTLSALYNSIITLKNVLPLIIVDKTAIKAIADTIMDNILYSVITINIGKRRIQNLGTGFDAMTTKSNFIYRITIERNSYLPVEVLQKNDVNNDFIKTNFSNVRTDIITPMELSWYYSTYTNDYTPPGGIPVQQLLSNGSLSPGWKLETFNENKTISLDDLKGKVVLLDFWIRNCGPCIQSVPHLNELQNKFKGKNLKIISINSYDSKEEVSWFCKKHKTDYTVLLNGKAIAEKFGVASFPTFFLLDKTGKIIYSRIGYSVSSQLEMEQAIKKAL